MVTVSVDLRDPSEFEEIATELELYPWTISVDVLSHDPRLDQAALEIVVGPRLDRVPPAVVRILGEADVGVRDVSPRPNGHFVVLAV